VSGTNTKTIVIAALALAVTFFAGFVVGVVVDHLIVHHGRGARAAGPLVTGAMLHRLDRKLDLTERQRDQIEQILQRRHERIHQLMETSRTPIHAEIEAANAEIERVLTPAQRQKFQELKMHLGPRMRHGGKRRTESTR
jgi:Spy/CpxP family protein refolding chaperone